MPNPIVFTPELITAVVASVISLVFSYFPWLSEAYAALRSHVKSFIMIFLMLIVTVVIVLLVQFGYIPSEQPITWGEAAYCFIQALIANAATYIIAPQPQRIKEVIEKRNEKVIASGEIPG